MLIWIGIAFAGFSVLCIGSAWQAPWAWLWILGHNYAKLDKELLVAIIAALLGLAAGTLYAILIAVYGTRGQTYAIAPAIMAQFAFIAVHGVSNARDALLLNLVSAAAFLLTQTVLLIRADLINGRLRSNPTIGAWK